VSVSTIRDLDDLIAALGELQEQLKVLRRRRLDEFFWDSAP
jgi:hypothetical protein